MNLKGLIEYYKECYREDSADFNLRNLQKLAKQDLRILRGIDEVANGTLHRLPILPEYGESFSKRVAMYQRERVLLHCSLFIAGKLTRDKEKTIIFSPLVFKEAVIEQDEYGYYFSVDESAPSINEELLSLLLPENNKLPDINPERIYDPSYWIGLLEQSPYKLNTLDALRFPQLEEKESVTKAMRRKGLSLLAVSALAFVERSTSSRGILHELSNISDSEEPSAPLSALLGKSQPQHQDIKINCNLVPALLSSSQRRVLNMAANHTLSAVSGPPGTGKSYTIAAIAAEYCTRGKSVLIAAGSETALDVIAEKMGVDFGLDNLFVRAGQKSFLKEFKQYLSDLLAGYYDFAEADELNQFKSQLNNTVRDIEKDEASITKLCGLAIKHGNRTHAVDTKQASIWHKLLHKLSGKSINNLQKLWLIQRHFNQQLQTKEKQSSDYLRALKAHTISSLLQQDRKAVQLLNKASRARTSSRQEQYYSQTNITSLLKGFPVWLVSLNTLHRVLPLQKEMFDLVIVDEATQCSISSVLPALFRAKKAVVVGDQKQLRHFSFLSKTKELQIAQANGVAGDDKAQSYRDNSILDLVLQSIGEQSQVAFLDEHFRSQPELIHFSNKQFYNDRLKVMQHRPCSTSGHIETFQVQGSRNDAGVNNQEAARVLDKVKSIIAKDKLTEIDRSIGVLSPFSKQSNYLAGLIERDIPLEEIEKHNIRVATPYGFQGEERDIMLLSFAIDAKSKRAAVYLNKEDVFNVSVTRARQKQYLFLSIEENELPENNLLKAYLSSIQEFSTSHNTTTESDEFQIEVTSELEKHNINCWKGYEMLGTYIDVLAKKDTTYLAIDLIGYPGPWEDFFELDTYKIIKRAGIDVFPLSYALWRQDKQTCLNALLNAIASKR